MREQRAADGGLFFFACTLGDMVRNEMFHGPVPEHPLGLPLSCKDLCVQM